MDGVDGRYENSAIIALGQIASYDLEVARLVASFAWVEDGITRIEAQTLFRARNIAKTDVELARLIANQSWMADRITWFKSKAIGAIEHIAKVDLNMAKKVLEEPFMEPPFRDRDAFALVGLSQLVTDSPPWNVMSLVVGQPWFKDGLDDNEAALFKVIGSSGYIDDDFRRALIETHYIVSTSIDLPLAGEMGFVAIRHTPFPEGDDTLALMETGVRAMEGFMGEPFPINDLILVLSEERLWPGSGNVLGDDNALHIRVKTPEGFDTPSGFAHAVHQMTAHFYLRGSPRWLGQGAAEFLTTYVGSVSGGQSIAERLALVESWDLPCMRQTIQQHLDNWRRDCDYLLGERFLLTIYKLIGQEGMSAGFRELLQSAIRGQLSVSEYVIADTLLRHTPVDQKDEFRAAYKRLHGPMIELAPPVPERREALVAIYDAAEGPVWEYRENWLSDMPLGSWHGVTADGVGRIIGLDLGGNESAVPIPPALFSLTNLLHLRVGLRLNGQIPSALGNLVNLRTLQIHGGELGGEIPPEIGNLKSLRELNLSDSQLSGNIPPELGGLAELLELILIDNQLSGDIPAELGHLEKLAYLYLQNNELSGELPSSLSDLKELRILRLNDNRLNGKIPAILGSLPELSDLQLAGNLLRGEIPIELVNLSKLWMLDLSRNQLSGEIPPEFGSLHHLRHLYLSGNELSGMIPSELGSLDNVVGINLAENRLTGEIPPEFGNLTQLWALDLSGNRLGGEIPPELGNLAALTAHLNLSGNLLSGEIPTAFGNFTKLSDLDLSGNQLSGEIPSELGNLTNLEHLRLSGNKLVGEIPAELASLANLETLHLAGNHLTGCIPQKLRDVPDNDLSELGIPHCRN